MFEARRRALINAVSGSNKCGDNAYWKIKNGVLTISGTGGTYDDAYTNWWEYKNEITSVVISEGITTIGQRNFANASNQHMQVQTITLPQSLTHIYYYNGLEITNAIYITDLKKYCDIATYGGGTIQFVNTYGSVYLNELHLTALTEANTNGLTKIKSVGFMKSDLTNVILAGTVIDIGASAFERSAITSVEIKANTCNLRKGEFQNCPNLTTVIIHGDLTETGTGTSYTTHFGISYNAGVTSQLINVSMPNVTKILSFMFAKCTSLALTSLPSGITSIGISGFSGCTSLALTSLPSGITSIGNSAFYNCTSLALTSLPSGITSIDIETFANCTSLALTSLPSGITSIERGAFTGCTSLALTSLPSGITSIGNYAFYNCTGLTSIAFEGTPTTISASAFSGCTNLTDIYVPWSEGTVANAPWGATNATIHYDTTV